MMRYFPDGFYGVHMIVSMIAGLIILAVIIGVVVYIVNKLSNVYLQSRKQPSMNSAKEEALLILNKRLANGEISEEEYERKKNLIINS